ncbi:MAG: hypothetical protein ACRCVW_04625 [Brevinema sp.]
MKKLAILFISVITVGSAYGANNYSAGNLLLGIGLGAGSADIAPVGSPQLSLNPSVELIFGAWNPSKTGIALGLTIDTSANFFGRGTTGTIAPMATMHLTFVRNIDWYVSLGMGMQLLPSTGTVGIYRIHVGFQTGFNFMLAPQFFLNTGMALHADQIFGTVGFKFRFGNYNKIK